MTRAAICLSLAAVCVLRTSVPTSGVAHRWDRLVGLLSSEVSPLETIHRAQVPLLPVCEPQAAAKRHDDVGLGNRHSRAETIADVKAPESSQQQDCEPGYAEGIGAEGAGSKGVQYLSRNWREPFPSQMCTPFSRRSCRAGRARSQWRGQYAMYCVLYMHTATRNCIRDALYMTSRVRAKGQRVGTRAADRT